MALTTRLMALTGLPLDMDVETKSASAIHACAIDLWKCPLFATPSASLVLRELVHEQANDLNDDDMDTTEAGIGDENEAFIDDENENYMDFEHYAAEQGGDRRAEDAASGNRSAGEVDALTGSQSIGGGSGLEWLLPSVALPTRSCFPAQELAEMGKRGESECASQLYTTTFLVTISWQPTVVAACAPRRLATRGPPPPVIPRPPLPGSPRAAAASQPTPAACRRCHLELPPPISLRAGPQPVDAAAIACCPRHRVPPTAAFAACRHDRGPSPSAVTAYCRRRDSAAACHHRHRRRRCYHIRPFEGGWGRRENGRRWDRKG
uniref:Uncharacterized protein n=1 Tax=Oryza sativa subsp. japonica TaxID=39947 RepID=Q67VS3_ORYSJ|nr:hypothetical protein [Oryza sativa Japonica Group]